MATYIELRAIFNDDDLRARMDIAVMVSANDLISGTPTADQQKWAAAVFANPRSEGTKAYMAVLAENKDTSIAGIQGASDAVLQTAVDAIVPSLVVAYNA